MRLCYKKKYIHIFNLNGDNHEYSTQSKNEPRIPLHETTYFYPRLKIHQNISDTILNLPVHNFKLKLKNFILETLYHICNELFT